MALSWSMDKLGPICRSAADAALILDALLGPLKEPRADSSSHRAFAPTAELSAPGIPRRVGVLRGAFPDGDAFLAELRDMGCELVPFELPRSARSARDLTFVLDCEAAAAFDELTRSGRDDLLVRQVERAWPNVFRVARLVPAVEYLQAQRLRGKLMVAVEAAFDDAGIDVVVHPPFAGNMLAVTNLTGNPTLVAPRGMAEDGRPGAVCFTGRNFADCPVTLLAQAWQLRFPHHRAARPAVR
jgi:Asp-tRNA(Asn)/Glu-tRNA(Gln) amidotransferase A subunit family amidase